MVGRKTFEGWPDTGRAGGQGADISVAIPQYVFPNTLSGGLECDVPLLEGDCKDSILKLKDAFDA